MTEKVPHINTYTPRPAGHYTPQSPLRHTPDTAETRYPPPVTYAFCNTVRILQNLPDRQRQITGVILALPLAKQLANATQNHRTGNTPPGNSKAPVNTT
ncbi:MAG: hypothetical protein GY774_34810 [Planctomycetes bacterium]|nr:hypothetical protein [Planctomycetota bacterium]